jgi:hypothetical protein
MARILVRTGVVALVLTASAVAGSALPARAVSITEENIFTYYSNAQMTTVVGQFFQGGCPPGPDWGTISAYHTFTTHSCPGPITPLTPTIRRP